MPEENVVYIGSKPVMNYVLACLTVFHSGTPELSMKARGRAISTAVDVAEILRHRFLTEVAVSSVEIGTESVTSQDGNRRNVSTISINLARSGGKPGAD